MTVELKAIRITLEPKHLLRICEKDEAKFKIGYQEYIVRFDSDLDDAADDIADAIKNHTELDDEEEDEE